MNEYYILIGAISFAAGLAVTYWAKGRSVSRKIRDAEAEAARMETDAKRRSNTILKEARLEVKDKLFKMKTEFDAETKGTRSELSRRENRLIQKEESIDRKGEQIERRDREVYRKEKQIAKREEDVEQQKSEGDRLIAEQKKELEKISGLTAEQAKELLIHAMENEARYEGAKVYKRICDEATENAEKESKKIMATAIQRYTSDFIAEPAISVVQLPGEDMKGRIIGREGRNIRAFEAATGVDLLIDDTREAVTLSGFNPMRREVARISLEKLISDGRIHPGRIEDVVKKVHQEVEATTKEVGEQAAFDLGIHGIQNELIKLLGQLKYRTSYGQNVLQHSIEVGFLCGTMAAELRLNQKLARRMGLLHDIGKAVDHEVEGTHQLIGARFAKKFGESPKIVHAIEAHHEGVQPNTVYVPLVQAADQLSGGRLGARKEMVESFVKRLEDLESIANSFNGVDNSYAIQAGRELRVMVESGTITDQETALLSRDVARKIEESLAFPGRIKVTVIRETRAVEYANR